MAMDLWQMVLYIAIAGTVFISIVVYTYRNAIKEWYWSISNQNYWKAFILEKPNMVKGNILQKFGDEKRAGWIESDKFGAFEMPKSELDFFRSGVKHLVYFDSDSSQARTRQKPVILYANTPHPKAIRAILERTSAIRAAPRNKAFALNTATIILLVIGVIIVAAFAYFYMKQRGML